ncbi:hypothetical protein OHA19_01265 [Streptomyces sp. NBC_00012]|uniref:hypothetical protein n=1 Tax=unclassified Streptomyces TaxID=2593676 RepID=UPI00324537FE
MTTPAQQASRSNYISPECRTSTAGSWGEGHRLCPGPVDIRVGDALAERLTCACSCHPRRTCR